MKDSRLLKVVICIGKWIIISVLNLILIVAILFYFEFGAKIADGINKEGLLSLRPEMTEEEVWSLIGKPICEKRDYGSAPIGHPVPWLGTWTWIYGKPSPLFGIGGGLEIYVRMRNGLLEGVYVEQYDLGVYKCDENGCPVFYQPQLLDRLPHPQKIKQP